MKYYNIEWLIHPLIQSCSNKGKYSLNNIVPIAVNHFVFLTIPNVTISILLQIFALDGLDL